MTTTVSAETRQETGKGAARKSRAAGRIPGVVYGAGVENTSISLDPTPLLEIFRKSQDRNTIIQLEIGGETVPTYVKDAQRHPLSREVLHVDFYRLQPGQEITVDVPTKAVGKPVGVSAGGKLTVSVRQLRVRCAWERIPSVIDVDVSGLDLGEILKGSQLTLPEGVSLVMYRDFPVASVDGKAK